MANYNTLISAIQSVIAENGNNEITGNILQQTLVAMISALGGGYQFAGVATPETTPGTPDEKIFYLGSAGTYPNFGPAVVPSGYLGVFYYDTVWHFQTIEFPIGSGTITKSNLSQSLLNELLNGFVYAGVATLTGTPVTPLRDSFYLTTTPGTYTHYGNLVVVDDEIGIFRYTVSNGVWTKESIVLPQTTQIANNLSTNDPNQALSAAMGKVLYDMFGESLQEVDLSNLQRYNELAINANNIWDASAGSSVKTIFLPLVNGIYQVAAQTSNNAIIAILSSTNHSDGTTPDFAPGQSGRITIQAGQQYSFQGTSGLYLACRADVAPSTIRVPQVFINSSNPVLRNSDVPNIVTDIMDEMPRHLVEGWEVVPSNWLTSQCAVADSTKDNFGNLVNSSVAVSSYLTNIEGASRIRIKIPVYTSKTTFGIVFYDNDQSPYNPISGVVCPLGNEYAMKDIEIPVPAGAKAVRGMKLNTYTGEYKIYKLYDNGNINVGYKLIAAHNSTNDEKAAADFICDGVNDELTIREAFNALSPFEDLRFAKGEYIIESFFDAPDGQEKCLLCMPYYSDAHVRHRIYCDGGFPTKTSSDAMSIGNLTNTARFVITQSCYDNLDSNVQYSIIRCQSNNGSIAYTRNAIQVSGISFILPGNQKNIICIDGKFASQIIVNNCCGRATDTSDPALQTIGLDGNIFIRGVQGSNFGYGNIIENCFVWGFGVGYELSGEHLVCTDLGTRFCNYGFFFNGYDTWSGGYRHPMVLINCCDECSYNMPKFGKNGDTKQSITLIEFNLERFAQYYAKGGDLAKELYPGTWRGEITYTMVSASGAQNPNDVTTPFWANDGSGIGIVTRNMAQLLRASKSVIATYAPNYNQMIYCTDLDKPLICTNPHTKEWRDFSGNIVAL